MTLTSHSHQLMALANAIPSRDARSGRHLHQVSCLTYIVATAAGISETDPVHERLALAARLQGVGKLLIPDAILDKVQPLDAEDWQTLRTHPTFAAELIRQVPSFAPVAEIVAARYEWWDGNGYPAGLQGEAIPWEARLLATASSLEAMTSARPYRPALGPDAALAELKRCSGTQFDPRWVDWALSARTEVILTLINGCCHEPPPGWC